MSSAPIQIPASMLIKAFEEKIKKVFGISPDAISKRLAFTLEEHAKEVERHIKADAISVHQLCPIILAALADIRKNAAAIDLLNANETSLLHVRHIEELATVIQYLVSESEKYDEYNWRWNNFSVAHGVRNKLLNLGGEIDAPIQDWVNREIDNLQKYIDKKITTNCNDSIKIWKKYSNWLYPISLKEIFEKTNRSTSYISAEYDWNSHSVHFSPMSDEFISYELEHHTYSEFSAICTLRALNVFYRECWVIVAHPERVRRAYTLGTFIEAYKLLLNKQEYFLELIKRGGAHAKINEYVLSSEESLESAIRLVAGDEKPDPLAISTSNTK